MNLFNKMIGKKVIVRSRNEGLNAGIVIMADKTGIELTSCRRLWGCRPKNKKHSWYEGVAMSGISEDSIVSNTVPQKIIIEKNYSVTPCTDDAFYSIMKLTPNDQD